MNEQSRGSTPFPATATAAEVPFTFEDFSPREQSWLRYQRWRYEHGLLMEFPDGQSRVDHDGVGFIAQRREPAMQPVRRFGRLR